MLLYGGTMQRKRLRMAGGEVRDAGDLHSKVGLHFNMYIVIQITAREN